MRIKETRYRSQGILEYVVVLAVVAAVLAAMSLYFRRSIQMVVKYASDQVGEQKKSEELDPEKGSLSQANTTTATKGHDMQYDSPGNKGMIHGWVSDENVTSTGTSTYKQKQEED